MRNNTSQSAASGRKEVGRKIKGVIVKFFFISLYSVHTYYNDYKMPLFSFN